MRRLLALAAVVLVAGATPAWAHEEINPSTVPIGRPLFLVMTAANEKNVDLTRVTVTAPANASLGEATRDPAGWTGNISGNAVTWTGGAVKPSRFEQFGFESGGFGQPGNFTYKVGLTYADGASESANVPLVAVADTSGAGVGTPESGEGHTHGEGEEEAAAATDSKGEARANLALGLSLFALAAAIGAFFVGRRSAGPPTPTPASTSGTKAGDGGVGGAGQDW